MFEFAWPWLFLLLPLPWLLQRYLPPIQPQTAELRVPFFQQLQALQASQKTHVLGLRKKSLVQLCIWLLLVSAAARPQQVSESVEQPSSGRDLLIALDVSSSMSYSDMLLNERSVSRLDFVKQFLKVFISERHGDRLGLILFGSQAYLQAPLTYDHHSVETWLNEVQIGIAGNNTSIGDAIGLAIKRLRTQPAEHRVLLLITDGANTSGVMSPLAAAQLAARYQIRIYSIGIGALNTATNSEHLSDSSGFDLDEQSLQAIAKISGGQYFHATELSDLSQIQQTLNQLEPAATLQAPQRHIQAFYSWPLAAAWLLSMLLVGRRLYHNHRLAQSSEVHQP